MVYEEKPKRKILIVPEELRKNRVPLVNELGHVDEVVHEEKPKRKKLIVPEELRIKRKPLWSIFNDRGRKNMD